MSQANQATERALFESWYEHEYMSGMDGPGEFDTERNCYVVFQVNIAWKGFLAGRASLDTQTGKVKEALELVVCEAEAQCGEPEPGCVRCDAAKLVRETFGLPPASMVDVTGEKAT